MYYEPHPITDQLLSANAAMHDLELHLIAHGNGTFPPADHASFVHDQGHGRAGPDTYTGQGGNGGNTGQGSPGPGSGSGGGNGTGGGSGGSTSGGGHHGPVTGHGGGSGYTYPHVGAPRLAMPNFGFPKLGNVPVGAVASGTGQPTQSNPAIVVIVLGAIAVGGYFLWHKLHKAHAEEHDLAKKGE